MFRASSLLKFALFALLMAAAGGVSLGDEPAPIKPEVTQHDIVPILLLRCTVCHGARKHEGELDLRSRASMGRGGKSGPAFVPCKPDDSLVLKRIRNGECPPQPRLIEAMVKPMEADELAKLTRWIALGAPEIPDEPEVAGTLADPLVRKEDREFWSFRPPQPVKIPQVAYTDRVRNPIDGFVLQKLEEKGLSLSPEADRLTLMRASLSPRECIKWVPISPAQPLQSDDRVATRRLQYDRPMRSVKNGTSIGRGLLIFALEHCGRIIFSRPYVEMESSRRNSKSPWTQSYFIGCLADRSGKLR